MAIRPINRLTALQISRPMEPGRYLDGDGLHLVVDTGKRWAFVYQWEGKRREMGFGRLSDVSLAEARRLRQEARELIRKGKPHLGKAASEGRPGILWGLHRVAFGRARRGLEQPKAPATVAKHTSDLCQADLERSHRSGQYGTGAFLVEADLDGKGRNGEASQGAN